jgi:hypothetical protein
MFINVLIILFIILGKPIIRQFFSRSTFVSVLHRSLTCEDVFCFCILWSILWAIVFSKKMFFLLPLNIMADFHPSEEHLRHCMLHDFHSGLNETTITNKNCYIYGEVLKVDHVKDGPDNL